MAIRNYKDLKVWHEAMGLAEEIYNLSKKFPKDETYGLTSQIRRAVVSIASNIAEGHSRNSTREYIQFISIAIGSLAEVETQLLLAIRLGYLTENSTKTTLQNINKLERMLRSLNRTLKEKFSSKLKHLPLIP